MSTFQFCIISPDARSAARFAALSSASSPSYTHAATTPGQYAQAGTASHAQASAASYSPTIYGPSPYSYVDPQATLSQPSSNTWQYQADPATAYQNSDSNYYGIGLVSGGSGGSGGSSNSSSSSNSRANHR